MHISSVLITPPTDPVVTLAEAKRHLNLEHDLDDSIILGMVASCVQHIDPAGGGWLGRALGLQTWELRLSGFFCGPIQLPYPPLVEIVSVKYDDAEGVERTLTEDDDFRVIGAGGLDIASIVPLFGTSWPSARCDYETVRIQYTCGYPVVGEGAEAVSTVPAPIQSWILLQLGNLYGNRESVAVLNGGGFSELPYVDNLLTNYRKRGPTQGERSWRTLA